MQNGPLDIITININFDYTYSPVKNTSALRISSTELLDMSFFYLWETAFDIVLPINKRTKKACEHFSSFANNCVSTCKYFLLLGLSDCTYRLGYLLCANKIFRWAQPFLAKASDRVALFCDAPNMTPICPILRI